MQDSEPTHYSIVGRVWQRINKSIGANMRDAMAQHLEKLRSGQVSYGAPAQELGGETLRVAIVFCGFCGGRIAADDIFCAHCGSRQPLGGTDSSPRLPARPTAKLIVAGTTELDASFNLQRDSNLVGRTDPLFADDAIARLHKASLGLPRALNNAAIAALIAAASAGKALVRDDCAKKAVAELTRE